MEFSSFFVFRILCRVRNIQEMVLKAKVTTDCLNLLVRKGSGSPRHTLIFASGKREPSKEEKDYVCKLFFQNQGGPVQPGTVASHGKERE